MLESFKISFICLIVSFFVCPTLFCPLQNVGTLQNNFVSTSGSENVTNHFPKITIGLVSCGKENDTTSKIETSILIKSILISALLYNVTELEFHIFLEHDGDSFFFENVLQEYGFPNESVRVDMYFHSAVDVVPRRFLAEMIYHKKFRCGCSRLYFSQELVDVDAIVYMDTDFVVTGNIQELWKHFGKMNEHQLIGVSPNNKPDSLPVTYKLRQCSRGVPHVHPLGLNSGLLLMNLTKMREYKWENKVSRIFMDYSKLGIVRDQDIINIILYYDPGLLYTMPCQYNVRCTPCNHGFICDDIKNDPFGIQSIHGANDQYGPGRRFYYIFKQYKEFNIANQDVVKDLMIPVIQTKEPKSKNGDEKCDPSVNEHLFKNILTTNIIKDMIHESVIDKYFHVISYLSITTCLTWASSLYFFQFDFGNQVDMLFIGGFCRAVVSVLIICQNIATLQITH